MISTPTVFVIGAGASAAYGLPLGSGLLKKARELRPESRLYQVLVALKYDVEKLNQFNYQIRQHTAQSIDWFLETCQGDEDTMKIGRAVIAGLMGEAASHVDIPGKSDWMGYILNEMRARTIDEFMAGNTGVTFITYNFDTLIEKRLRDWVASTYKGATLPQSWVSERVLHVHGSLAEVPIEPTPLTKFGTPSQSWINWLASESSKVHVVMDDISKDVLSAVADRVGSANVVCFLGFAYDVNNLRKLGWPESLKARGPYLCGSAMGFLDGEQAKIERRFDGRIKLGTATENALAVLRKFDIFRD